MSGPDSSLKLVYWSCKTSNDSNSENIRDMVRSNAICEASGKKIL